MLEEEEDMDQTKIQLNEYLIGNYNLQVLTYFESEPNKLISLNLSKNNIKSIDYLRLDLTPNIEFIDLSFNQLTDLSHLREISLPRLKTLDLKYNQISDFSFLSNFQTLKTLDIRGNVGSNSSLPYWVVTQLSELKWFNGKDISIIRKYMSTAEKQLISSIDTIFINDFASSLKRIESTINEIKTQFIETLIRNCDVNEDAKNALRFQIKQIVGHKLKQHIQLITDKISSDNLTENNNTITSKSGQILSSRKESNQISDRKLRFRSNKLDILAKAITEAIGDLKIIPSPVKSETSNESKQLNNISNNLLKNEDICESNGVKRKLSEMQTNCLKTEFNCKSFPLSYELINILRIHSRKTEPIDLKHSIWDIKYKPIGPNKSGSDLFVSCGGSVVNIVDLKTGSVVKRYEDQNISEMFNCVVWREFKVTLKNGLTRDLSVLCVGGTKKDKKLVSILFINADDMDDYLKIGSHMNSVNCLVFHPLKKSLLFSGSYDRKIILWSLDSGKMTDSSKLSSLTVNKLKEIDCNNRILSSVFSKNLNILVVSGEDGIVLIKPPEQTDQKKYGSAFTYKVLIQERRQVIDGLVLIATDSNLIAFRLNNQIIVADLQKMIESAKNESKGMVPLVVVNRLRYCSEKCNYFYMTIESRLLTCGTADGHIYVYYLKDSILESCKKDSVLEPIRILKKPELSIATNNQSIANSSTDSFFVNIAAVSPDHQYIIGGTNCNMLCIWKRIPRSSQNSSHSSSFVNKKLKTVKKI